ncbi:hypothetical protein [Stenotrophomonas maltophilia]|uniref:hypothetical protein n=1 Tax=Stenotrophomonas maltophilia TaxID=40324 RepID=UPI00080B9F85|nr:hypothetical protein [Stenotrophomonas maltophilia]
MQILQSNVPSLDQNAATALTTHCDACAGRLQDRAGTHRDAMRAPAVGLDAATLDHDPAPFTINCHRHGTRIAGFQMHAGKTGVSSRANRDAGRAAPPRVDTARFQRNAASRAFDPDSWNVVAPLVEIHRS